MENRSKTPFILILLLIYSVVCSAVESNIICSRTLTKSLIDEFSRDIERVTHFEAKDLAKKLILKQCMIEKDNGNTDIIIRSGKVFFTEYSDRFDPQRPLYFCKNNAGYQSYLSYITARLMTEINPVKVIGPKRKQTKSRRVSSTQKKIEPKWACTIPHYIKNVRVVTKDVMETLSMTYGDDSCKKVQ